MHANMSRGTLAMVCFSYFRGAGHQFLRIITKVKQLGLPQPGGEVAALLLGRPKSKVDEILVWMSFENFGQFW